MRIMLDGWLYRRGFCAETTLVGAVKEYGRRAVGSAGIMNKGRVDGRGSVVDFNRIVISRRIDVKAALRIGGRD